MWLLPSKYSFRFFKRTKNSVALDVSQNEDALKFGLSVDGEVKDSRRRLFLKLLGCAGVGIFAASVLPKKAEAIIMGGTPSSAVVGLKNSSNTRVNPATEDSLLTLIKGQGVSKVTTSLAASGNVKVPTGGTKLRVYATRFSLTADATAVSFSFTSGGTIYETFKAPKTGGLYGSNNHPNYVEGGIDEALYCTITGTTTVQINVDYLEV